MDEKKTAGASYILTFYQNVNVMTNDYATYLNLMLELEHRYKDLDKLQEHEREIMNKTLQIIRHNAHKTYIQYTTIIKNLKNTSDKQTQKEIEENYTHIKNTFVIDRTKLEKFVKALNQILVSEVIQNLLESSQELIEDIYQDGTRTD